MPSTVQLDTFFSSKNINIASKLMRVGLAGSIYKNYANLKTIFNACLFILLKFTLLKFIDQLIAKNYFKITKVDKLFGL